MAAAKRQKIDWITGWVQRAQLSNLTLTHADEHVITLSDGTRVLSGVGLGVTSTSRVPVDGTEEYYFEMEQPVVPVSVDGPPRVLLETSEAVFRIGAIQYFGSRLHAQSCNRLPIEKCLSATPSVSATPPVPTIHAWQYPPGSGKTYRIIRDVILAGEDEFRAHYIFVVLTKPHSAKEVIKKEFEEQLRAVGDAEIVARSTPSEEKMYKSYWFSVRTTRGPKPVLVIMATMDSFVYNLSPGTDDTVLDHFEGLAKTIADQGPRVGRENRVYFKGKSFLLGANCLIVVDEATKLSVPYLGALQRLAFVCKADALCVGDQMQSVEMNHNILTHLFDPGSLQSTGFRVIPRVGTEIRRFGPKLVAFLNRAVRHTDHGMEQPVAARGHQTEGAFRVEVLPPHTLEAERVEQIMRAMEADIQQLSLLPHEILIVSPCVARNSMLDHLCSELQEFYSQYLVVGNLGPRALKYLDDVKQYKHVNNGYHRFAVRHFSESGKSVDTKSSVLSVRMVSIHSAQGDGRRYCVTIDISESSLKLFTRGEKHTRQYESLLCVALSRAKEKLALFLSPRHDDVFARFLWALPIEERRKVEPEFYVSTKVNLLESVGDADHSLLNGCSESVIRIINTTIRATLSANDTTAPPMVDMIHHLIRSASFHITFLFGLLERHRLESIHAAQLIMTVEEICKASVKELAVREYYKTLREWDNSRRQKDVKLDVIPILRDTHSKIIAQRMRDVLVCLREGSFEKIRRHPLLVLMFWYAMDYKLHGKQMVTKMGAIHEIFHHYSVQPQSDSDRHLQEFYNTLKRVEKCLSLVLAATSSDAQKTNWLAYHRVTLGRPDGDALMFQAFIRADYIVEAGEVVYVVFLLPQTGSIQRLTVGMRALLTPVVLLQPATKNNKNERFRNKRIRTLFASMHNAQLVDMESPFDALPSRTADTVALVAECIRAQCSSHHSTICDHHDANNVKGDPRYIKRQYAAFKNDKPYRKFMAS